MEFTQKHPVLLIHGMWSTGETLQDLKAVFEGAGYETHTPTLPSHILIQDMRPEHKSALAHTSLQQYVAFLLEQVKHFKQPPIILGHSMGGLLAQLLTQEMAKQGLPVHRLLLLSSAAPAGINSFYWSVVRTLGHNLFKYPMWKRCTNLRMGNIAYGIANTQDQATQTDIYNHRTLESGLVSWQMAMWFLYRKAPSYVDEKLITCPVLILGGTKDRITPFKIQKALAKKYQHTAHLVELDGACHWTVSGNHLEKIEHTLLNWLDNQAVSSAA